MDLFNAVTVVMRYPVTDSFWHSTGDEVLLTQPVKLGGDGFRQRQQRNRVVKERDESFFIVCTQELPEVQGVEGYYIDLFSEK